MRRRWYRFPHQRSLPYRCRSRRRTRPCHRTRRCCPRHRPHQNRQTHRRRQSHPRVAAGVSGGRCGWADRPREVRSGPGYSRRRDGRCCHRTGRGRNRRHWPGPAPGREAWTVWSWSDLCRRKTRSRAYSARACSSRACSAQACSSPTACPARAYPSRMCRGLRTRRSHPTCRSHRTRPNHQVRPLRTHHHRSHRCFRCRPGAGCPRRGARVWCLPHHRASGRSYGPQSPRCVGARRPAAPSSRAGGSYPAAGWSYRPRDWTRREREVRPPSGLASRYAPGWMGCPAGSSDRPARGCP